MRDDRGTIVNQTLRWLDEHAQSGAEHCALRQIWSNHVERESALFRDCRTACDVLNVFGNTRRLDDEPWIGVRSVTLLQRIVARAVLAQVRPQNGMPETASGASAAEVAP